MSAVSATLIIGAARSGTAALELLRKLGTRAYLTDDKGQGAPGGNAPEYVSPERARQLFAEITDVVVSPGVDAGHPLVRAALAKGLLVRSELALGAEHASGRVIAVTGTNGKSTVTTLLGAMLRAAGRKVFVGGNLGTPLCMAGGESYDDIVLEVSSFQLEWPHTLQPAVASVLNVTRDHLDRHGTMDAYIRAKMQLFANMNDRCHAVFCRDQDWWRAHRSMVKAEMTTFGRSPLPVDAEGTVFDPQLRRVAVHSPAPREIVLAASWPMFPHDIENVAAAAEMARLAEIPMSAIEKAIAEFQPLAHRLAWVGTHRGVRFFDDSKATNVGATLKSLEAFAEPVILLVGGVAKGAEFTPLADVAAKLKCVVAYGEAAAEVVAALSARVTVKRARGMDEAFAVAVARAEDGDVVLLAPACASFDEFRDYAHRGERFVELVAGHAACDARG